MHRHCDRTRERLALSRFDRRSAQDLSNLRRIETQFNADTLDRWERGWAHDGKNAVDCTGRHVASAALPRGLEYNVRARSRELPRGTYHAAA